MKHIKLFEQFVNENLNEGAVNSMARDYQFMPLSEIDMENLYYEDDQLKQIESAIKKYKNKGWFTNAMYVRDLGDSWDDIIAELDKHKVEYTVVEDPNEGDHALIIKA